MDYRTVNALSDNVLAAGWVRPDDMPEFTAFCTAAKQGPVAIQRLPVQLAGTAFVLESGQAVTTSRLLQFLHWKESEGNTAILWSFQDVGAGKVRTAFFRPNEYKFVRIECMEALMLSPESACQQHADLAVIRLPSDKSAIGTGLPCGDITSLHVSDTVVIAGFAMGTNLIDLPGAGSRRLCPMFVRANVIAVVPFGPSWTPFTRGLLLDAAGADGFHGAPACSEEGKVLGVVTGAVGSMLAVRPSQTASSTSSDHEHDYEVNIPTNIARAVPLNTAFRHRTRALAAANS